MRWILCGGAGEGLAARRKVGSADAHIHREQGAMNVGTSYGVVLVGELDGLDTVTWMGSARETRWPGCGDWLVMTELPRIGVGAETVGGMAGLMVVLPAGDEKVGCEAGAVGLLGSGAAMGWAAAAMWSPAVRRRSLAVATVRPTIEGMT